MDNSYDDKQSYGKDNNYYKSEDSSNVECNNINVNVNGFNKNELGTLPTALSGLATDEAQAADEQTTRANAFGNSDRNNHEFKKSEDSAIICISNNDNQATPTEPEPDPGICESPIDLVIVLDDTGSMGETINNLKAEFDTIISQAETASSGDLRVGFITFKDNVTVVNELTTDINAVNASINAATPTGGNDFPEASDLAKETAVNDLTYRAEALKIVILITDAPPSGGDNVEDPADHQRMIDAATAAQSAGIKVSDIYITGGDGTDPTDITMKSDATISGGIFVTDPDGTGTAEAISDIIVGCGTE
jgi:Mg-chelatase subunit ChlD